MASFTSSMHENSAVRLQESQMSRADKIANAPSPYLTALRQKQESEEKVRPMTTELFGVGTPEFDIYRDSEVGGKN